jgi:hypothetical protein
VSLDHTFPAILKVGRRRGVGALSIALLTWESASREGGLHGHGD